MLLNSSWIKEDDRLTILKDHRLNYNGQVYEYTTIGDGNIKTITWNDNEALICDNKLVGWEQVLPSHNPYYQDEWQKFLFMFFPKKYCGDKTFEKKEIDSDVWREWKMHYLNENPCNLISPRKRESLRLSSSPTRIGISPRRKSLPSEQHSPRSPRSPLGSPRSSYSGKPLRLNSSPGRCQNPNE